MIFFSEDGNKLITPKNFTTTGKANFTDTNTKWTTEISDKKYICRPNDLLVLLTDLTQSCELLGKPILLSQDDGNVLLNQRIVKIIPNRKLEKPFLLYLLLTDDFHVNCFYSLNRTGFVGDFLFKLGHLT
ncbi:restriction endonuclease subunit S domain-containing protein [Acinetobacter johnsonii]|uniref:hypothetical protein n=1 Tax=Acinetobacter johnsonii TaxID=40214 RepID=UPI001E5CFB39|nr:hypothetical protein [Acinetobacter johnsonii]